MVDSTTNRRKSGIGYFFRKFKVEYDLLKRSGLLESGKCECKCKLKEVIFEQPNQRKTV
jgi:hypothetical protein